MTSTETLAEKLRHLFATTTKPDGTEFTPGEVQELTGGAITSSYLYKLLSGEAINPSMRKIQALADFFEVDPGFFF